MKIAVVCNKALQEDFLFKKMNNETALVFVGRPEDIPGDATVVMDLLFENRAERNSAAAPIPSTTGHCKCRHAHPGGNRRTVYPHKCLAGFFTT